MANNMDKILLFIFAIGTILVILSSNPYSIEFVSSNYEFGLLQMLPFSFWFGFILCIISTLFGLKIDSAIIFYFKSALIFVLIWNIPILFLKNVFRPGSYSHIFEAIPITLSGHIPKIGNYWLFNNYPSSYPGYSIVISNFLQISNLNYLIFSKVYPFFSSIITFIVISIFFKTFFNQMRNIQYKLALLLFTFSCVYLQFQVSPESMGFITGILIVILLSNSQKFQQIRVKTITILLFFFIVISHPTTLSVILPFSVIWLIIGIIIKDKNRVSKTPILLFIIIWILWMVYFAFTSGQSLLMSILVNFESFFSPDLLAQEASLQFGASSAVSQLIRFLMLASLAIPAIYMFIMYHKKKPNNFAFKIALIITPIIMSAFDVAVGLGLYDRYFLFFTIISIPLK